MNLASTELLKLPITMKTAAIRQKKMELERKIQLLETDIEKFQKPGKVWVPIEALLDDEGDSLHADTQQQQTAAMLPSEENILGWVSSD